MDSWPPEEKMGVAERAAFQAIEPIRPLRRAGTMRDVAGDHLYSRNICSELLNTRGVELDCRVRLAFFVACWWFFRFKT